VGTSPRVGGLHLLALVVAVEELDVEQEMQVMEEDLVRVMEVPVEAMEEEAHVDHVDRKMFKLAPRLPRSVR